jgi:hypothetical protein
VPLARDKDRPLPGHPGAGRPSPEPAPRLLRPSHSSCSPCAVARTGAERDWGPSRTDPNHTVHPSQQEFDRGLGRPGGRSLQQHRAGQDDDGQDRQQDQDRPDEAEPCPWRSTVDGRRDNGRWSRARIRVARRSWATERASGSLSDHQENRASRSPTTAETAPQTTLAASMTGARPGRSLSGGGMIPIAGATKP